MRLSVKGRLRLILAIPPTLVLLFPAFMFLRVTEEHESRSSGKKTLTDASCLSPSQTVYCIYAYSGPLSRCCGHV